MRRTGLIAVSAALAALAVPAAGRAAQAWACTAELSLRSGFPAPLGVYVRLYRTAPQVAILCPWRTQGGKATAVAVWRPAQDCVLPAPFQALAAPASKPQPTSRYTGGVIARRCSPFFKMSRPGAQDDVYLIRPLGRPSEPGPDRRALSLMADLTIAQTRTGAPYPAVDGAGDWMCVAASPGAPAPLDLLDATVRPGAKRRFSEERRRGTTCADVVGRRSGGGMNAQPGPSGAGGR